MEQESGRADSEDEEFFDPSEASPARTGSSPGRPLSRRLSSAETSFHDADEAIPGQQPVYGYLHELVNAHRIGLTLQFAKNHPAWTRNVSTGSLLAAG